MKGICKESNDDGTKEQQQYIEYDKDVGAHIEDILAEH